MRAMRQLKRFAPVSVKDTVKSQVRQTKELLGLYSKPAFLIIGPPKTGTSSLAAYLRSHPSIVGAVRKELRFFNVDKHYAMGYARYHAQFPSKRELPPGAITFEATPGYLNVPTVAPRIYQYNPEIKLIAILRDPVKRAVSQYRHLKAKHAAYHDTQEVMINNPYLWQKRHEVQASSPLWGLAIKETLPTFEELISEEMRQLDPENPYPLVATGMIAIGLYAVHLERYYGLFPRDQVLIVDSQQLSSNTKETLNEVIAFLGLPGYSWDSENLSERHNASLFEESTSDDIQQKLRHFYQPYNERLFDLLGREFDWQ
jgi:hypothetical protein